MSGAWRAILRQPVLAWRLQGMWLVWALLAGAVLGFCGFGIGLRDWRAGVVAAGVFLTALIIAGWLQLLTSAIRQNEPALACLVPHQRRRIVTVVTLLWLAGSLAIGLVFGVGLDHFGYALLAGSATLLYFAALQRMPWLGAMPFAIMIATRLFPPPSPGGLVAALGEGGSTVAGMLVLLVLAALLARALFPRGGERHIGWHRRFVDRASAIKEAQGMPGQDRTVWRAASWRDRPYLAALRRLSDSAGLATPPRHRAGALLLALGGSVHPGAGLAGLAAVVVLALACGGALLDYIGWQGSIVPICTVLLVFPLVTHVHAVTIAMQRFRAEQALLRLCPAAPDTRHFNRALAAALLRRFALMWFACTASAALVSAIMIPGVPAQAAVGVTAALTLSLATCLLRDYAGIGRLSTATLVLAIVAIVVLTMVLKVGMAFWRMQMPWLLIGCLVLVGAGLTYGRWRRMPSLPVAFPAGRNATD